MLIKDLQILTEALWESVKHDLDFFSAIQFFVRKLAEFDYSNLNKEGTSEILLYISKIEDFFKQYRPSGSGSYIPPNQTYLNDDTVRSIWKLSNQLAIMTDEQLQKEVEFIKPKAKSTTKGNGMIFIGHGRSKLWARVQVFLKDDLNLNAICYESESHTSESIVSILEEFLDKASYAILVLSAEDETIDGKIRARQNVIHEAGLFQGRLGFDKVIILKQTETEEFTNISGLQYIPFSGDGIEQTFYELQRKLKKSGLINN